MVDGVAVRGVGRVVIIIIITVHMVPTDVVPTDVVPTDVVPTDVVLTDVVPTDVVPTDATTTAIVTNVQYITAEAAIHTGAGGSWRRQSNNGDKCTIRNSKSSYPHWCKPIVE